MRFWNGAGWVLLSVAACGCVGPRVGRTVDASLPESRSTRVTEVREAGPFFERVETSEGAVRTSVRPLFYTRIESPKDSATLTEVLWPVYADRTLQERFNWRFLSVWGRDADVNDPASAWHLWAFPFWFQGRDEGGQEYAAFFPLGGTMRDFLMFDEFSFCLWPIWSTSKRHGIDSTYVLWPIYSRNEGDGIHNERVFPFWGKAVKDGVADRRFILWPMWNQATYYKGDVPDGQAWSFFLVAGHTERPSVEAWQVIPPFFQVSRGRGRFEGDRQILAPWPLVRISDVRGIHKRHFYPFYATTWGDTDRKTSVLWPFYSQHDSVEGEIRRRDWSFAPIFHRSLVQKQGKNEAEDDVKEPETVRSYTRVWPLFSVVHEAEGSFFRFLDFSLHRRVGALERNLLQMPVVYTRGRTAEEREDEALWGLFRWRRDDTATREFQVWPIYRRAKDAEEEDANWSILQGFLGRENRPDGSGRRTRLLWFLTF